MDMYEKAIRDEFLNCAKNTIIRLKKDPTKMPFHEALMSKEAIFWSRFERSFSTSFGQSVIERISALLARATNANNVTPQKDTIIEIDSNLYSAINQHVDALREKGTTAITDWHKEVDLLRSTPPSDLKITLRIRSDLYYEREGTGHYFSIKTVKPNIDQTAAAKKDLLFLKTTNINCNPYFCLYYNPFGDEREEYNWSPPKRLFNFHTDECVLIGKDFWDTIGGTGSYEQILTIANSIGPEVKKLIEQYGLDNL
jgi:hypothetical protein